MISFFRIVSPALLASVVAASCECGFSVNSTDAPQHQVFTEFVETDFTQGILGGWIPQNYTVPKSLARGPYGKIAAIKNVVPSKQGLQLWVKRPVGDAIPIAEVSTQRTDMLYGSFRIKAKMTGVNGTCGAFFWFRNNTQEIDMEFLSKQYDTGGIVNLVNQSPESQAAGFNAAYTPGYDVQYLPFRPDGDFHEYRFDWIPGSISYYADDVLLRVFTQDIPNSPGHMVLNHWSNGDAGWSAGPPVMDTAITVAYTHLYFNSSEPRELQRFNSACPEFEAGKVCKIQDNIAIPLMPPVSTSGNSFVPPYDGPGYPPAPPAPTMSKNASRNYVIAGVVIGAVIIVFILAMMTVRRWGTWNRKLRQKVGFRPVVSPTGKESGHIPTSSADLTSEHRPLQQRV